LGMLPGKKSQMMKFSPLLSWPKPILVSKA